MAIAYTSDFTATTTPVMLLGRDTTRKELAIYNTSDTDFIYLGFGLESSVFTLLNSLPLAPGESYDATIAPLNSVFVLTESNPVPIVVYWSSVSPNPVEGALHV